MNPMLASNDEALLVLPIVAAVTLIIVAMRMGHSERMQRLRLVEQAMRDPKFDQATRQQLIHGLTQPIGLPGSWRQWFRDNLVPRRVFAGAAWLAMIIGGLIVVFGGRYDAIPGIVMCSIGLAVMALPLVIRELEGRAARR